MLWWLALFSVIYTPFKNDTSTSEILSGTKYLKIFIIFTANCRRNHILKPVVLLSCHAVY